LALVNGDDPTKTRTGRRAARRRKTVSQLSVVILAAASAVGAALAGCHPTGSPVVDVLYAAAFGALLPVATSRSNRATTIVVAGVAVAMSRGWMWVPSGVALGVAFGSAWKRRRSRRYGALVGALAVQCILRWPPVAFYGATALVAAASCVPVLVSAYLALGRRSRRRVALASAGLGIATLVLGVPFVVGVIGARSAVDRGVAQAKTALADATSGGPQAVSAIDAARSDLASAATHVSAWWTAGAGVIPVEAEQRRAVLAAVGAAQAATANSVGVAGQIGALKGAYHDGQLDVASLEALGAPVHQLDVTLAGAQRRLARANSSWLVAPLASRYRLLVADLAKAHSSVHLADQAIPLLPGFLGSHGPRHYLIVFMTPSEARGLDGFIGSYAEVSATAGRLSLTRSGPITQLTSDPAPRHITGYSQYLARYGTYDPAKYIQDVSYSPDFPTVAGILGQLYPQAGGDHVDGVLALDPFGLAALLNFTGPISVPGLPVQLSAANAAQELTLGQYEQSTATATLNAVRRDALQSALQIAFSKLTKGSLPSPRTLSSTLDPVVRQGRIMFWSFHPDEQPLVASLGLSGAFPTAGGGDLLAVTMQNADNNKIDAFLTRTIDDKVHFNPSSGAVTATVTVTLHNAAPSSGLPGYLIGSHSGSHIPPGANLTWLTLYSPLELSSAKAGTQTLPTSDLPELGVHAYGGFVLIPSGQTVTVTYTLVGHLATGSSYRLAWRTQPTDNPGSATVELSVSNGWTPVGPTRWVVPDQLTPSWTVRLKSS
jgi:hypothetical protein